MNMANNAKPIVDASDIDSIVNSRLASIDAQHATSLYVARNMPDLPKVYQAGMPSSTDPKVLARAEQTLREQWKADMREHSPNFITRKQLVDAGVAISKADAEEVKKAAAQNGGDPSDMALKNAGLSDGQIAYAKAIKFDTSNFVNL
jgi:hypothetical protein